MKISIPWYTRRWQAANIAAAQARVKAAYAVFSDVDDDAFPKGAVGAGYSASKHQLPRILRHG